MYVIPVKKFVGPEPGPRLLITAGVHGDEYEPMQAARRLAAAEPKPLRGELWIAPLVNEPAFRRGARAAQDGLDLARTCPGRDDGSITERVAAALSRLIAAVDFYIDLHTGGALYEVYPLAGYMLHENAQVLDRQRGMAQAFGAPVQWGTSAKLDGRSLSVARDHGVPAIYAEHGGGGNRNPQAIRDYEQGCLQVAASLGLFDSPPNHEPPLYVVEDAREGSGHMQVQHRAPRDGFFEPAVALGDRVRRGDRLGAIVDAWGEPLAQSLCEESGLVLFLRVPPAVVAGDALGGLLPLAHI